MPHLTRRGQRPLKLPASVDCLTLLLIQQPQVATPVALLSTVANFGSN